MTANDIALEIADLLLENQCMDGPTEQILRPTWQDTESGAEARKRKIRGLLEDYERAVVREQQQHQTQPSAAATPDSRRWIVQDDDVDDSASD
jgi:hypothetical protein